MDGFVTPGGLRIDGAAMTWLVTRSGGPGGQHANTSDTAVTVVVDVAAAGLADDVTERLVRVLGPVVTARSSDTRSQARNRELALGRLAGRLDRAAVPPKSRRPTRVSRAAKEARRQDKARRSTVKQSRRRPRPDDLD
jgi:ribosome-associated protein